MINIKDYEIQGSKFCECGHEFTMNDFTELKRINEQGFYANQVKHYSSTTCPKCHKETILLLKQVGQTYNIIDIATEKNIETKPIIKNSEEKRTTNEFICPECKKACKNKLGLTAHLKTHNK